MIKILVTFNEKTCRKKKMTNFNVKQRKIPFHGIISCLEALSLLSVTNSKFVKFPDNAIILEHESSKTIDMACKSDAPYNLRWYVQKNHDSEKELLYNGYFLRKDAESYCTVITDEPGKYNLHLRSKAEAAQTYICLEPGSLAEVSAELIWLSDLICVDSSTEDLINLTCSVEFRGNWAPTMEWKEYSSIGEKVLSVGVSTVTVPNRRVTSTLAKAMPDSSRNYTCTTKFDITGKPPHAAAKNVPDCNLLWTTSVWSKVQDESLPTWIVATAIITSITIAAILIMLVVLFIRKKYTRDRQEKAEQSNEATPGTRLFSKKPAVFQHNV